MNRRDLIIGAGAAVAGLILPTRVSAERKLVWGGDDLVDSYYANMLDQIDHSTYVGFEGREDGNRFYTRTDGHFVLLQEFEESADNSDVSPANVGSHCPNVNELAFVTEINNYRAQNGRAALQKSRSLMAAARHHAYYMSRTDDVDHTLGSVSWIQNIDNYGYPEEFHAGENVLAGRQSAGGALALWKTSATHNANMLDPDWIRIGVGRVYYSTGRYDFYWCTTFGDGSHRTFSGSC